MNGQKMTRLAVSLGGSDRTGSANEWPSLSHDLSVPQAEPIVNDDLGRLIAQAARLTALHLAAGHPERALRHLLIGRALASLVEGEGAHGT